MNSTNQKQQPITTFDIPIINQRPVTIFNIPIIKKSNLSETKHSSAKQPSKDSKKRKIEETAYEHLPQLYSPPQKKLKVNQIEQIEPKYPTEYSQKEQDLQQEINALKEVNNGLIAVNAHLITNLMNSQVQVNSLQAKINYYDSYIQFMHQHNYYPRPNQDTASTTNPQDTNDQMQPQSTSPVPLNPTQTNSDLISEEQPLAGNSSTIDNSDSISVLPTLVDNPDSNEWETYLQ